MSIKNSAEDLPASRTKGTTFYRNDQLELLMPSWLHCDHQLMLLFNL